MLILSELFKTYDNQGNESSEGLQKLIGLCINELKQKLFLLQNQCEQKEEEYKIFNKDLFIEYISNPLF